MDIQDAVQALETGNISALKINQKGVISDKSVLALSSSLANTAAFYHRYLTSFMLDSVTLNEDALGFILLSMNAYKYQSELGFTLSIKNMHLDHHLCDAILPFIRGNQSLTELELTHCQLNCAQTKKIVKALKTCPNLKKLNLDHNHISDNGAAALGELLQSDSPLRFLSLNHNRIGQRGGEHLRIAIRNPNKSSIEWLRLENNAGLMRDPGNHQDTRHFVKEIIDRCLESRREHLNRMALQKKAKQSESAGGIHRLSPSSGRRGISF